jgi:uncharacterized protein
MAEYALQKSVLSYIVTGMPAMKAGNKALSFKPISTMKLHLTQAAGNQLITGYGIGWVEINAMRHTQSLIVMPNQLIEAWTTGKFDDLAEADFLQLTTLKPEVILLGTGPQHRFIHPRLTRNLTEAGISIECMDTAAACRTYNILMAEGRHVAAALLI